MAHEARGYVERGMLIPLMKAVGESPGVMLKFHEAEFTAVMDSYTDPFPPAQGENEPFLCPAYPQYASH